MSTRHCYDYGYGDCDTGGERHIRQPHSHYNPPLQLGLYKTFVYFENVVRESTILSPPRPPALPTLVQYYYCTIIGQYTTPLPISRLYAIHNTILVITIACKGQSSTSTEAREQRSVPW